MTTIPPRTRSFFLTRAPRPLESFQTLHLIKNETHRIADQPFVRKVRVCWQKKLDYKFEVEDVWAADTRIMDANPLGRCPVWSWRAARRFLTHASSSNTSIRCRPWASSFPWADESAWKFAPGKPWPTACWMPPCWRAWSKPGLAVLMPQRSPAWIDRQLEKVHASLKAMSLGLGDRPGAPQATTTTHWPTSPLGCALGYLDFRFPQIDWREGLPQPGQSVRKLSQRQSFLDTAPPQA